MVRYPTTGGKVHIGRWTGEIKKTRHSRDLDTIQLGRSIGYRLHGKQIQEVLCQPIYAFGLLPGVRLPSQRGAAPD